MEYKIQYSKIKNIYIQIKEGKVIVKAPKRVTREEIEKILKNKEKWINKSLDKDRKKGQKENLYKTLIKRKEYEIKGNELKEQEFSAKPDKENPLEWLELRKESEKKEV